MIEIDYLEQMKPFPPGENWVEATPRLKWHKDKRRFINIDLAFIVDIRLALIVTIDEDGTEHADIQDVIEFSTVDGLNIFARKDDKLMWLIEGKPKSQNQSKVDSGKNGKYDTTDEVPMNRKILKEVKKFDEKVKVFC